MRISMKIKHFLKTYFWPLNGNIDQTWGLNIEVHHSRLPKSYFIFMNHHYDVINIPFKSANAKTYLTHHFVKVVRIHFFFTNSLTRGEMLSSLWSYIHRIASEVRKFSMKSVFTIWHITFEALIKNTFGGAQTVSHVQIESASDILFLFTVVFQSLNNYSDSRWKLPSPLRGFQS